MSDDDELFRRDLRRAVATADVDDAWGTIARRVRVQRAGRTTARIGIPVLCAVALIGGAAALSNRTGSTARPAERPTTSLAVDTTATTATSTTAGPDTTPPPTTSVATSASTPLSTSPTTTAAEGTSPIGALPDGVPPVLEQPDTWTRIARTTSNGRTYDIAAFDLVADPVQHCLSVRLPDSPRSLADVCPQVGRVASVIVDGGMFVFLVRADAGPVTVRTSAREFTVDGFAVGDETAYVTSLPPGIELVQMGDGPDLTACPPREVWAALDATGGFDGGLPSLSIQTCAASGAMQIGTESTARILQPGGGVARRTASGVEIYAFGGTYCDPSSYLPDTPEQRAKADAAEAVCRELGILVTPSS